MISFADGRRASAPFALVMNETVSSVGFGGLGERLGTACGEEELARQKLCEEVAKTGRFFPASQAPPFFWKKPADFRAKNDEFFPFSSCLSNSNYFSCENALRFPVCLKG